MLLTKFVLRKPVTALLIILSVAFFGIMSFNIFKFELVPDISMPMYVVYTIYPGAAPEDVDKLVTKKIETNVYNLSGVKDVTCVSRENISLVVIQYDYNQNMDIAYNDLKKSIDRVKDDFNDTVQDPIIMEMDINSMPTMKIAVRNKSTKDIYNYVSNVFAKEIEKVSDVSTTDISGGREDYIKIELIPEKIERYNLSMSTLKSIITAADFAYPEGSVKVGNRKLSVTSEVSYDTIESLKNIPIITGNKHTLYLEDIANIYKAKKDIQSFGRYDSEDCMVVSVQKIQSSSSVDVSKKVKRKIEELKAQDPNLLVEIVNDQADNINASIKNVFQTMIMAVVLSMAVIYLFLGDMKASLIVGTSIPFSLLVALVSMYLSKFTLNLITLSAMVLGVGMMVDNSIVVLEACFRAKDNYAGDDPKQYIKTVLEASDIIGFSVFGSTVTTVVVFAPLGFLSGMSGQFFKPLGFTIVYCMIASLISALTIVPLVFVLAKPIEKETSFAGKFVRNLQDNYRIFMAKILKHKKKVLVFSIAFLILCFMTLPTFKTELVSPSDEGMIKIDIQTMPSLIAEKKDEIYRYFEDFVSNQNETEHYLLSNSASSMSTSTLSSGQSLIVYLKKHRKKSTNDLVIDWKKKLTKVPNCTVDVTSYSTSFTSSFVLPSVNRFEIYLESSDFNELRRINNKIVKELEKREDVSNISTYMDSDAPIVKIQIDPILCAAEGFTPALVGGQLNNMISGVELYDMIINDETLTINMKYQDGEYDSLDKIENILLTSASGNKATVKDLAHISIEDTPATVQKYNKKYRTRILADYNQHFTKNSTSEIRENIIKPNLMNGVTIAKSQQDEMLDEEFGALARAVLIAIFLVFVVMASQFESLRYSLMVMGTVLFSFAGAVIFLWLAGLKLSMVALLGLLMLVGTAVNNGILYVDTVNQYLDDGKELYTSIIEAGAIRLRPILMTTLTTIVSMIPMSLAYGRNGEVLQGLGVADIGGLVISTIMALYILPVLYAIFSKKKGTVLERLGANARQVLKTGVVGMLVFIILMGNISYAKEYNIAQHIYKLKSQEQLNKLNDNKIEFDEIDDLVNSYNATVRNNWNSYEANKDSMDVYNDYYEAYDNLDALAQSADSDVQAAMFRAQADAMRINADKNVSDSTINFLNYYIVEKNTVLATKTLFINVYKYNINLQIKKEELEEAKRQFESAKLNYEEGNLIRVDYLQALKNWRTAEADVALISSNITSAKRNLLLNCGKNITDNVEIAEMKHVNIDDIHSINLYEDTNQAIENNYQYDIYKRQYENARSIEMQNQNKINIDYAPNYIKSDVEEKYYALVDANTALYTYQTAYDYQEQSRKISQNEFIQGKISEKQYKTAVSDAYIASLNSLLAQFDLDIAYENYKAVVSGLANAGNT